jgi:Uma2 family endonuclease
MNRFLEIPALAPRSIVLHPPLSDEEFERLSETCDCATLERSKEGTILVNAPAGGMTSDGNSEINRQLRNWWIQHRRGRAYDSCCGFFLPDGSSLSPDAAYVAPEQLTGMTRNDRAHFLRLAPAFMIELRSESDSLAKTAQKMEVWMANGVQLGWLIDPYARQVHIYEPGATAPRIEPGTHVAGSGPVAGFVLDLEEIWRCYE